MTKDHRTVVLLDAHAIIHRAYHALPDFYSSTGEPTGALYGLSNMVMKIISDLKPDYIIACYDLPQKTFRHEAYDGYKAGRAKADPALVAQLQSSRKIFDAFNIPIYDAPGFEADDELGTISELLKNENIKVIIASGDMDTMQLVDGKRVQVYTLKKGINDTIIYDEEAVVARFGFKPVFLPDYKGLRGDPSDNIIGIKGIGEKTATTLIQEFGAIEAMYEALKKNNAQDAFKKIGISERIFNLLKDGEEEALFSKTLATIRKDAPIDFKLPEQTFWQQFYLEKLEKLFIELEFRSLMARLRSFNNSGEATKHLDNFTENLGSKDNSPLREYPKGEVDAFHPVSEYRATPQEENLNAKEIEETAIALWLVNSEISNPNIDDILHFAKTQDFKVARDFIFGRLKGDGLEKVYEEIEKPIIPIVHQMEKRGILLDQKYFKKLSTEYQESLDEITQKIYKLAGTEFNINSPKQMAEVLFEKMGIKTNKKRGASGSFSTKASILEELEEGNPIITEIMSYREISKLLSTYINVLPGMVADDGRLHAKFIQNATTTGRFSSLDPNLQNLPIKSELGRKIRDGFVAAPGHQLLALDYSQIELRVAAILSEDENLTEIFREGKDVHSGVASFVFGVPIDKVDKEMRRKAKVINFGIIYGMGVTALRKNLGGTREEAQRFYDNYFRQFKGVAAYLEQTKEFAKAKGYTETLFGRRRYFKDINSRLSFIKNMAERTATNAPIQGTATADIIKLAIRYAHEDLAIAGLLNKAHLILQIHDELVYEVEDDVLDKATEIIKNAMEGVLARSYLKYKTEIPLVVGYGSGKNLGEVK
ncbi:MAG: DNA polymerase [Candidatus Paceibacterota bacterium]